MKFTVDTNVLVRAVVRDDKEQARAAAKLLKEAEIIAVSLPSLCEFVWVLRRVYDLASRRLLPRSRLCSTPVTSRSTGRRSSSDWRSSRPAAILPTG